MGIQIKTLNYLLENIGSYFSDKQKDLCIGELGDQMIKRSCYEKLDSIQFPLKDQVIDTGYGINNGMGAICSAKDLFSWYGYNHVSFDLNGLHGAKKYDFSRKINEYKLFFDIFTNIGSSEHIGEKLELEQIYNASEHAQYYCFKNIHNMLKRNGLMIHVVPLIDSWGYHGRYRYSKHFFDLLAKENNYKVYHYEIYQFSKENYYNGSKSIFIALGKNIDNDFMSIDEFDHMPGLFDISNGKE